MGKVTSKPLRELISEDFKHDRLYGTVRTVNPFLSPCALRLLRARRTPGNVVSLLGTESSAHVMKRCLRPGTIELSKSR